MFSHVMVGADDLELSRRFYDATFATLGIGPGKADEKGRIFYISATGRFAITTPLNGEPASGGNGATIGFSADTPQAADAWHAAGLSSGGTACEDPPGVRERMRGNLHLAYLRDPAGNKLCALYRF
jgi:catechol 2,3-dioxygenase-like lactoylglutathione lyase family enzyme